MNSVDFSKRVRDLSLRLVAKANASHIGSALSIADLISVLYADDSVFSFPSPTYPDRDRLILSKGHACVAFTVHFAPGDI